jgi:hypothetical protein
VFAGHTSTCINPTEPQHWARRFGDHTPGDPPSSIVTSGKGQVIYPILFETSQIERQGSLKLYCLPGSLKHQGEAYDSVVSNGVLPTSTQHYTVTLPEPVTGPINCFRNPTTSWKISVQDNGSLLARIIWDIEYLAYCEINPLAILMQLKSTLLVENCGHSSRAQLPSPNQDASFIVPWKHGERSVDSVNVVPVDGADDVRCFAVGWEYMQGRPVVLRGNSCLACCLEVCRATGIRCLIL